jgi:hypothetical protein
VEPSDALRALSGFPKDETANSAPVAILYDLAREHYPDRDPKQDEYRHMVSIEAEGAKLTTGEISVSVQALDDGTYGVRLQTANTSLAPGLYVGQLTTPQGATLAPVQLYLSRATGA